MVRYIKVKYPWFWEKLVSKTSKLLNSLYLISFALHNFAYQEIRYLQMATLNFKWPELPEKENCLKYISYCSISNSDPLRLEGASWKHHISCQAKFIQGKRGKMPNTVILLYLNLLRFLGCWLINNNEIRKYHPLFLLNALSTSLHMQIS